MPPSIRYINQSAPFWDFVASMENGEHPFFSGPNANAEGPSTAPAGGPSWATGAPPSWAGPWGGRHGHGHRGWHHANMAHRAGPPNNEQQDAAAAADSPATVQNDESDNEKDVDMNHDKNIPDPPEDTPPTDSCAGRRRHCRGRREGGSGCEGRRGGGRGAWHHGGFHPYGGHRGGPWANAGGWTGFGPRGFRMLSELFGAQAPNEEGGDGDWSPESDVFDTPSAFVIHISLPGANKEDIGVTWDPERSELQISGVVHRPGDEEFLKTLAMEERKVGAFERKVRLGTRAHPAQVDVDGISAKLENGILVVEVPKMLEEFVEVKKVDIE